MDALHTSHGQPEPYPAATDPVRVLHVIPGLRVGGAEAALASLVAAQTRGLTHVVVSLESGGFHAAGLRQRGVQLRELEFERRAGVPIQMAKLVGIIRAIRPDVVQGWLYRGNIAALLALSLSGRRSSTRLAWGIRSADCDLVDVRLALRGAIHVSARLSPLVDVVVANSEAGLNYHVRQRGFRSPRGLVIHNGVDTDRFRPDPRTRSAVREALGLSSEDVVAVHVARVHPTKDHGTFINAVALLKSVKAVAVGAGTESLPALPNLIRLGERADVPALLTAADIIASSSISEGFPNALAEGMAAGLVPVATEAGDSRIIVGDTGAVVPARSEGALSTAIMAAARLERGELRTRGAKARERICSEFGMDSFLQKFSRLYFGLHGRASEIS